MDKKIIRKKGATVVECGKCGTVSHLEFIDQDERCPFCDHVFTVFKIIKLDEVPKKQKLIDKDVWILLKQIENKQLKIKQLKNYIFKYDGWSFDEQKNKYWSRSRIDKFINARLKARNTLVSQLQYQNLTLADLEARLNEMYRAKLQTG